MYDVNWVFVGTGKCSCCGAPVCSIEDYECNHPGALCEYCSTNGPCGPPEEEDVNADA